MFRNLFFLVLGLIGGLWLVWPGIIKQDNWVCAKDIILKSQKEQIDIRTVLAVSPRQMINRKQISTREKIRILGDACFR